MVKNNFALGYSSGDFILHSNVNDGSIFGASLYQKVLVRFLEKFLESFAQVKPGLETGVNLGWTASRYTETLCRSQSLPVLVSASLGF